MWLPLEKMGSYGAPANKGESKAAQASKYDRGSERPARSMWQETSGRHRPACLSPPSSRRRPSKDCNARRAYRIRASRRWQLGPFPTALLHAPHTQGQPAVWARTASPACRPGCRRERERGSARLQKDKYQNAKTRVRKQHFARVDHAPVHERDERRMVVGQLIRLTPFHEREELRDLARRVIVHIARSHRDQVRRPQHAYDQRHCDQRPKRVSGVKQGGKASRHDRAPRAGIALPFASGQAVRLARRLLPSQSTRQGNASGNEHREQEAPDGDQRKDEPHAKHQLHIGAIRPGDGNARCQNEGCDRIERKVFEATVNADARAASRANVSHGRPTPG